MLGNNNENNNGTLYVLKVKVTDENKKKLDHPVFEVKTKNETGQWVITNTVPSVSGRVSKLDIKENDWEGEKYYTASLLLKDDEVEESYLVDLKVANMMNRSIFNSLLNIDVSLPIKLGLYTSKKGYPTGSVRQGENLIDWKFSLQDQPKAEEIQFKGKVMRDYSAVDKFFVDKLREFSASLGGAPEAQSKPASTKAKAAPKKKEVVKDDLKLETVPADESDDLF